MILAMLATVAMGRFPPNSVPEYQQDKLSEKAEDQLGIEDEKREHENDNEWVEFAHPESQYNYWETGAQVTDSGKKEAPQAADLYIPEIIPVLPKTRPDIPCKEECRSDEYCWEGRCLYRPWLHNDPKYACYPNPSQPGLSIDEKMRCRKRRYDKKNCLKTSYCEWLSDAPMWYKPYIDRWIPPPPERRTLSDKMAAAVKNFAVAAVSRREDTGAEILTRAQQRANDEDKFIGGLNLLPYHLRPTDDSRAWKDPFEQKQYPPLIVDVPGPPPPKAYPTNTTGPRFSENLNDPAWQKKSWKQPWKSTEDSMEKPKPPAPAPAPAPSPSPGPSPSEPPASPAFLEIRQHPYI